jgi:hypothetical protein
MRMRVLIFRPNFIRILLGWDGYFKCFQPLDTKTYPIPYFLGGRLYGRFQTVILS